MILVDANLLLYAYNPATTHHDRARAWLEGVLSGPEPVRLAWVTILAFLRITTNTRVFEFPFSIEEATGAVSTWLARPTVAVLEPGERYWAIFSELLGRTQSRGTAVMDAHMAALAIEHGATLCSSDRDFMKFPGARLVNPLEPAG